MISEKKRLQIANICYANVACEFAMFTNPKNRGPNFTWERFIERCEESADLWMMVNRVCGPKQTINDTARQFAREISTTLVERATEV